MTKTKSTKRALLMSALSLLMCVSMLIGSTFAWFTDSVSSMNNIIKSGNLDVEMEYYDGDSWEKVTATTNVFEENTLWEPGHTEVVYLRVSNLGTLALKYNLGINIVSEIESINVAGEALRLSDYIEFGAIESETATTYADRAAARAAVTNAKVLSEGYTMAGNIKAGEDADYVALVVYMPETVGNEANYRTGEVAPEITLGLNLMATQYTHEEDSFDNQYDADAMFNGVPSANTTTIGKMPVVTSFLTGIDYTLDCAYMFNTTETYEEAQKNAYRYWHADFVAYFNQDVNGADFGLWGEYDPYNFAFELDDLGPLAANTPVRMLETAGKSMNYEELCLLVKKFSCGAFAVDQAAMEGKTMTVELRLYETTIDPNANSGSANIETGDYITVGTYSYTFGAKKVSTVAELKKVLANGGEAALVADINESNVVTLADVPAGVSATLDLNGHNITASLDGSAGWSQIFHVGKDAALTVKGNGNVHAVSYPTTAYGSVIFNNVGGTLTINGGTYTMDYGTYADGYLLPAIVDTNSNIGKATTIINGGTFYHNRNMFRNFAQPQRGANNATLIINGGTFNGEADDYASIWNQKTNNNGVVGDGVVELNGGTFNYIDITNDFQDDSCITIDPSITNVTIKH